MYRDFLISLSYQIADKFVTTIVYHFFVISKHSPKHKEGEYAYLGPISNMSGSNRLRAQSRRYKLLH